MNRENDDKELNCAAGIFCSTRPFVKKIRFTNHETTLRKFAFVLSPAVVRSPHATIANCT